MSALRGAAAGVLGLTMLQVIVSSDQATSNASGLIGFVTRGLARWFNPYTPLIPDLRKTAAATPLTPPPPGGHSEIVNPPGLRDKILGTPPATTPPATTSPRSHTAPQPV